MRCCTPAGSMRGPKSLHGGPPTSGPYSYPIQNCRQDTDTDKVSFILGFSGDSFMSSVPC